jgi:ubiquinone/menaquinone biosynthesis C-methylase UbiE
VPCEPSGDDASRVRRVYERYGRDPSKQRDWSAANPGNACIRAELISAAHGALGHTLKTAGRVLDVGCGTGWWLAGLASDPSVSASLHGVELLPERVSAAIASVPQASIELADARALPYEDDSFDLATLFLVLSSMRTRPDAAQALNEAHRVLAPGGVLLIWEPRIPNPLNRETVLISARLVRAALRGATIYRRTLTVLPPLARRLGSHTQTAYPLLRRIPVLRTHQLFCVRFPEG